MDDGYSSTTVTLAQEGWLADITMYPAGEKRSLVYAKSTGAACLIHAAYSELLGQCREFKTLDAHLEAFCQGKQISKEAGERLRSKLEQFAREGYLIPQSQVLELFEEADEPAPPTQITAIGFPTCNRVETLQSSLSSYLEHCQHFGRSPEFVVMDDSPSPNTREAYREMLRNLQRRSGLTIAYAGIEEKMSFVRKLSKEGQIPEEVVSWACIGDLSQHVRTGANRNALLLHTVGECLFISDDDVICRVAASPGLREGLVLHAQGDPLQYRFYPDRESVLEASPSVEQDILALHEQWLGQDPLVSGAPYRRSGQLSVEQVEPAFLHRLATQPGKIILTAHGVVGDVSCRASDFLFSHPSESMKQQTCSEQAYRWACTSREIAQVANQLTLIANPFPPPAMCIGGLDNRELLPPFPHIGRCQDVAFGNIFGGCFPDAYAVYLPWSLLHNPRETRPFLDPGVEIPFFKWLYECVDLFHPDPSQKPAEQLVQLGQFLESIGRLSTPAFEAFARHFLWQHDGDCIADVEHQLHRYGHLAYWKQDAEMYCARLRQNMLLPIKQRLQGGAELAQRSLVQFAQILRWWPAIVEATRRLRIDGCRVAQPLEQN